MNVRYRTGLIALSVGAAIRRELSNVGSPMKRSSLILTFCLIFSFFPVTHAGIRIQGKVKEVISGDRFLVVLDNGTPSKVKLCEFSASVRSEQERGECGWQPCDRSMAC
jgi:hypothetical protein